MKIREFLFRNFKGCTNHGCIITGPKKGMGTNGSCTCLFNLSRAQLHLLNSRLYVIGEKELPEETE